MAALAKPARVASASLLRLQSDAGLATLARDGHEEAFDALVHRYRPELVRASNRIVGPSRGEDAVQQALLNAHRAIDTTADVQNLRAWLHRITHNSSLNLLRTVRDEAPLDAAPLAQSQWAGPAEAAELAERLRETFAAIDTLPENQRAALLLRELEGRSHEDIAMALGITSGAARQALLRGRQAVRGAATALTPYPLMLKLAAFSAPGAGAGVAELVGGVGATATLAKLGATIAATGAIAGGVVGADVAVKHGDRAEAETTTSQVASHASPTVGRVGGGLDQVADNNGTQTKTKDKHDGDKRPVENAHHGTGAGGTGGRGEGRRWAADPGPRWRGANGGKRPSAGQGQAGLGHNASGTSPALAVTAPAAAGTPDTASQPEGGTAQDQSQDISGSGSDGLQAGG